MELLVPLCRAVAALFILTPESVSALITDDLQSLVREYKNTRTNIRLAH